MPLVRRLRFSLQEKVVCRRSGDWVICKISKLLHQHSPGVIVPYQALVLDGTNIKISIPVDNDDHIRKHADSPIDFLLQAVKLGDSAE